jgi:type VI secretion system protein VasJ
MDLNELGKQPIPGDKPAGQDVRYEESFDALQAEIDKLSIATTEGEGIDWDRVVQLSQTILAEKSKNIQVAAYLAVALTQTRGVDGLATGLTILEDLVENFWETMYPPKKRKRGRFNAVTWFRERVESYLESYAGDTVPADQMQAAQDALAGLDQALAAQDDDAPILSELRDYLSRLPVEEPPAEAESEPEAEGEKPAEQAAPKPEPSPAAEQPAPRAAPPARPAPPAPQPAASAAPEQPASQADVAAVVEAGLSELARAADYLIANDPANPQGYRLNRVAAWLTVDQAPMSDGKQTQLPAPDEMIMSAILGNFQSGRYENAVAGAESRVRQYLFWLDLSRITAQSLEQLGGRHQKAAETVALDTALFVHRLPGIERLTFQDGTPFADKDTRAWLKGVALGGGDSAAPQSGGDDDAEVARQAAEIQKMIRDQKAADGLKLAAEALSRVGGKKRFLWNINLARIMPLCGRPELARAYVDDILADIERFQLERWDPPLALAGYGAVFEVLSEEEDEAEQKRAQDALAKMARIDPSAAFSINSS